MRALMRNREFILLGLMFLFLFMYLHLISALTSAALYCVRAKQERILIMSISSLYLRSTIGERILIGSFPRVCPAIFLCHKILWFGRHLGLAGCVAHMASISCEIF